MSLSRCFIRRNAQNSLAGRNANSRAWRTVVQAQSAVQRSYPSTPRAKVSAFLVRVAQCISFLYAGFSAWRSLAEGPGANRSN